MTQKNVTGDRTYTISHSDKKCITEGCDGYRLDNRRICAVCKYKRLMIAKKNRAGVSSKRMIRESEKPMKEDELFGGRRFSFLLKKPLSLSTMVELEQVFDSVPRAGL